MTDTARTRHTIIARVDNRPGVLSRISGFFTRRGYNIESLVTGMTEDAMVYQMTICVYGTQDEIDLLIRQLGRIMEVIEVAEATSDVITRELMLIRLTCTSSHRSEAMQLASVMGHSIAGVTSDTIVIEVTGDEVKLESALRAYENLGAVRLVRSGVMGLPLR